MNNATISSLVSLVLVALVARRELRASNALARGWKRRFRRCRSWVLPLVSVLTFIRISTDRRLSDAALTAEQAAEIVGTWLQRDNVSILEPGARHWPIFFDTLIDAGATGPRTADVHLAALAIEHGATLCTNDRDFRAFTQLALEFPLRTQ